MGNRKQEDVQHVADVSSLRGTYHIGGGIKDRTKFDPIRLTYNDDDDSAKSNSSGSGGVDSYSQVFDDHIAVQTVNWAHDIRHSPLYLLFIILSLVLTTVLLVWAVVLGPNVFNNPGFLALEFLTLFAVAFNTVVEVVYVGGLYGYLCVPKRFTSTNPGYEDQRETDVDYRLKHKTNYVCMLYTKYGVLCMNWFQLLILVLAIASFSVSLTAVGKKQSNAIEEAITLGLLLARYAAYILTLVISQYKAISVQGGIDNVFRKT